MGRIRAIRIVMTTVAVLFGVAGAWLWLGVYAPRRAQEERLREEEVERRRVEVERIAAEKFGPAGRTVPAVGAASPNHRAGTGRKPASPTPAPAPAAAVPQEAAPAEGAWKPLDDEARNALDRSRMGDLPPPKSAPGAPPDAPE